MEKMVLGVFEERMDAEDAINELEDRGYRPQDISIVMKDTTEARTLSSDSGAGVAEGAVSGATTGGAIGALAGILVATGVIPGLGALLIGGPLAAALGLTGAVATTVSGAATGVLAGGLIGALTGWGVPEEDAQVYEDSVRQGGILLMVPAHMGEEEEVRAVLADFGASQVKAVEHSEAHEYAQNDSQRFVSRRSEEEQYGRMGYKGGRIKSEGKEVSRKSTADKKHSGKRRG